MQAQLSELQKMLCKISEVSNINNGRVEQNTGVSNLSDSKAPARNIAKGDKNTLPKTQTPQNFFNLQHKS